MPRPAAAARTAKAQQPLEYNLLLTVTLCLLAAGTVMVYSASSRGHVLQGVGDGSFFLVRYAVYGRVGLVVLSRVASPRPDLGGGADRAAAGLRAALPRAVMLPGLGVTVNGAPRWVGAGPLTFQPSELMKLALVLYAARFLAQTPRCIRTPPKASRSRSSSSRGCLLVASQPDLGTALVIAFTLWSVLVAGGFPAATADRRRRSSAS